jgi:DNA-binding GntR family transcriptional regulator
MLNHKSPIPLYHQLADILLEQIRSGHYKPGQMIPSETGLAKQYSIGRPTVHQAMDTLVWEGDLVINQQKRNITGGTDTLSGVYEDVSLHFFAANFRW